MNSPFYLLNVTINGIKNIQKPIKLNFYKDTVTKNFDGDKYRIKAIYGENGTGKTALLTGVKILKDVVLQRGYLLKNENILNSITNVVTHKIDLECEFLAEFTDLFIIMKYNITVNKANDEFQIIHERLSYKLNASRNQEHVVYETINGELKILKYQDNLKEKIENKTKNLLANDTFINLYWNCIDDLSSDSFNDCVYETISILFLQLFMFDLNVSLQNEDHHDLYRLKNQLGKLTNNELFNHVDIINKLENISRVSDDKISIKEFKQYENRIKKLCLFLQMFKRDLVDIHINKRIDGEYYICNLELVYNNYSIDLEFESSGIKNLVQLFDSFDAVAHGQTVFIDELDANINEVYLNVLIDYFMNYTDGQLIFTTHNSSPMNLLKENKESISFLSSDNTITTWTTNGNASPESAYRNGMIEDLPFNIYPTDFIGIFGDEDE